MHNLVRTALLWVFLASTLLAPLAAAQGLQPAPPADATGSASSVSLSLVGEAPQLKPSERAEGAFLTFDSALTLSGEPGAPALPTVSRLVGIPTGVAPQVAIQLAEPQGAATFDQPLEPVPTYEPVLSPDGQRIQELAARYTPDAGLYAADAWYPANPVSVGEPMVLRGQTVVRVAFTPVQVNLATRELRWLSEADVTLSWDAATVQPAAPVEDPYFESVFQGAVANYEQARAWRSLPQANVQPDDAQANPTWTIKLQGKGLFRIALSDLAAAGVPTGDLNKLALYYGSGVARQQQAIWIDGDQLYLINTREPGRWSKQIVYQLEVLPSGSGLRMAESASPATQPTTVESVPYDQRFEQDVKYVSNETEARPGEHWHWDLLYVFPNNVPPGNPNFSTSFSLPHLANVPFTAQVTTEMSSIYNYRCHWARVLINGTQRGERGIRNRDYCLTPSYNGTQGWSDLSPFGITMSVPQGELLASGNTFAVEQAPNSLPGDPLTRYTPDALALNSFTVRYQRLLKVDAPSLFFNSDRSTAANWKLSQEYRIYLPIVMDGSGGGAADGAAPDAPAGVAEVALSSDLLAFEVSNANTPRRLTGGNVANGGLTFGRSAPANEKYMVSSQTRAARVDSIAPYQDTGLRSNLTHADYLIITHPDFQGAIQPLVARRQSQYATRVVTTDAIYNDFGNGTMDPAAIRAFVDFAYDSWQGGPPAFVLLVGDATYDPFDIKGTGRRVWLPPMMRVVDEYIGEAPSDNGYVNGLDAGETIDSSPLPDIHIGRLAVNSASEAAALAQKIVNYETASPNGAWQRNALLTTDNIPDDAGNFHALSDSVLPLFPEDMDYQRAYQDGPTSTDAREVRDEIKDWMNEGVLLVQYIGHGSQNQWAYAPVWTTKRVEGNVTTSDLDLLAANSRLPMALAWTCWEGYFIEPGMEAMSESMLRLADRGIIASFSPTGLDVATGHDYLTQGFFEALFDTTAQERRVGVLTDEAKLSLWIENPSFQRLLFTYMVHGDPATTLRLDPCVYNGTCP